jgi:protein NrfD
MQDPVYVESFSTRLNPHVDPALHVWGWEVPFDLFLGGVVAGLLVLYSITVLMRAEKRYPTVVKVAPLLAVPLLSLGLLFLFLDLEYKLHAFRFYTTFELSAPMSWGSWIIMFTMIVGGVQFLYTLAEMEEFRNTKIGKWGVWNWSQKIPATLRRKMAWCTLFLGVGLGTYTGLLLASSVARPLWNSGLVAPIFLVSGLATGAAMLLLLARAKGERKMLVWFAVLCLALELLLIVMWIGDLTHGSAQALQASELVLGGAYSAVFWTFVVAVGLVVPAILELQFLRGRWAHSFVAPALILVGGLVLRLVLVQAGQSFGYGA